MILSRIIHICSALLLAGWLILPTLAKADELIPLPALSAQFDLTSYAASTDSVKKTSLDLPNIDFEISLPKTWIERSALGQRYGELYRYEGPAFGDVRPFFSFRRIQIKRENTARLELIAYLLKQSYVLRALREDDERNVEALYVMVDNKGDSFAVRIKARLVGADLLLAEYGVPMVAWDVQRDEQTFAINSFKFLKDSNDTIEQRVEHRYFNALRFFYPASWGVQEEFSSSENIVNLNLVNKADNGMEGGRIRLTLASVHSLKDAENQRGFPLDVTQILKDIRKSYEDKGYVFIKSFDVKPFALNLPVGMSVMNMYQLGLRKTKYETDQKLPVTQEFWLAMFRTKDVPEKVYIMELLTPAREQDLYLWSINTRAFELVLKSIQ